MSNAVQVIDQEIKSIEELLAAHSYHLYALRDLRDRLVNKNEVSTNVSVAPVSVVVKDAPKKRAPWGYQMKRTKLVGEMVAKKLRENGGTKAKWVRFFIDEGVIEAGDERRVNSQLTPSYLGKKEFERIFKGTPYGR